MFTIPIALTGGLIGAGVGLALFSLEYLVLRAAMADRAKRRHRKAIFDPTERRRIAALARFGLCVPPAFALFFWYVWG